MRLLSATLRMRLLGMQFQWALQKVHVIVRQSGIDATMCAPTWALKACTLR